MVENLWKKISLSFTFIISLTLRFKKVVQRYMYHAVKKKRTTTKKTILHLISAITSEENKLGQKLRLVNKILPLVNQTVSILGLVSL